MNLLSKSSFSAFLSQSCEKQAFLSLGQQAFFVQWRSWQEGQGCLFMKDSAQCRLSMKSSLPTLKPGYKLYNAALALSAPMHLSGCLFLCCMKSVITLPVKNPVTIIEVKFTPIRYSTLWDLEFSGSNLTPCSYANIATSFFCLAVNILYCPPFVGVLVLSSSSQSWYSTALLNL